MIIGGSPAPGPSGGRLGVAEGGGCWLLWCVVEREQHVSEDESTTACANDSGGGDGATGPRRGRSGQGGGAAQRWVEEEEDVLGWAVTIKEEQHVAMEHNFSSTDYVQAVRAKG